MALGTQGPEGPWVAAVYFAADVAEGRARLYFLSSPTSRHGRNLAANPAVAAAINEDEHDWRAIRGIQLEGVCEPVAAPLEALRAWRAYFGKYPFVRQVLRGAKVAGGEMAAKLLRTRLYQVRVRRLFYLDNRLGFGDREEVPELSDALAALENATRQAEGPGRIHLHAT